MFQQDITAGPGTGTFASHTLEILIMLTGAFLLGLWFGWVLWNKYKQAFDKLRLENDGLQAAVNTLNADLSTLKARVGTLDKEREDLVTRLSVADNENLDLRSRLTALQSDVEELVTENRQLETEVSLHTGESEAIDDLAGEATIETESPAPHPDLAAITDNGAAADNEPSDASAVVDLVVETPDSETTPATEDNAIHIPEEAFMVSDDEHFRFVMQEPNESEAALASARSVSAPADADDHFSDAAFLSLSRNTPTAPQSATGSEGDSETPVITFAPLQQDDLKIIEGIGPKIEELLFKAGIHTYSELAAAPVQRLKEILAEAGPRFSMHDPGTWSAQALLAANGEWENLKAYQGFLDSGKAPGKK